MSETQMPRCMFETILERFGIVPTLVYVYVTAVEHRHGRRYEGRGDWESVGISICSPANSKSATTAYDSTCGSGSLLLKVAAEAGKHITLEGQEKDVTIFRSWRC